MDNFVNDVMIERERQDCIHPRSDWPGIVWATVMGEEYGEICRAILENDRENLKDELVQLAAVCMRVYENIETMELFDETTTR